LAGLLNLFGCSEKVMPRWKRQNDSIIGVEENGSEIVRVPFREPLYIREAFDKKYNVARVNCP
jgi:nitrate reductase beta subunit